MAKEKWMQAASAENKAAGTKGLFKSKAQAQGKTTRQYAIEKYHAAGKLGKEAREAANMQGWR